MKKSLLFGILLAFVQTIDALSLTESDIVCRKNYVLKTAWGNKEFDELKNEKSLTVQELVDKLRVQSQKLDILLSESCKKGSLNSEQLVLEFLSFWKSVSTLSEKLGAFAKVYDSMMLDELSRFAEHFINQLLPHTDLSRIKVVDEK